MIVHLLQLCVAAVFFFAAIVAFAMRPLLGVGVALAVFVIATAPRTPLFFTDFNLGNLTLHSTDLVAFALVAAFGLRTARGLLARRAQPIVFGLLLLVAVHVLRGTAAFGVQTAINGGRTWIWFASAVAFGSTVRLTPRFLKWLYFSAATLAAVAVAGFAATGVHSAQQHLFVNGRVIDSRPVAAAGALLLLQGTIALAVLGRDSVRGQRILLVILAGLILLLQHRTVWVATIAVAVIAYIAWSRANLARRPDAVFTVTGVAILLIPVVIGVVWTTGALRLSVAEGTGAHSTLLWRTQSWAALLSEHHSFSDLAVGLPSGAGWERTISGGVVEASPHSMYVEALLRFGLMGLFLLFAAWGYVFRGIRRQRWPNQTPPWALYALLVSQLVYSIAYPLGLPEGLLLGVLVGASVPTAQVVVGSRSRTIPEFAT